MTVLFCETRTLTQADFDTFARISGDDNPIHVSPVFAARTRFGRTVAHGMLLYSVLWALVQRHRPGARQAAQALMFPNPTFAGEAVIFEGRLCADDVIAVRAYRANGDSLCEGTATLAAARP